RGELPREGRDVTYVGDGAEVKPLGQLDVCVQARFRRLDLADEVAFLPQRGRDVALGGRLHGGGDELPSAVARLVLEYGHRSLLARRDGSSRTGMPVRAREHCRSGYLVRGP